MSAATTQDPAFLGPSLVAGYQQVSANQEVEFIQYVRKVLPLDGYVFWLKTLRKKFVGSLHISIDQRQNEDDSPAVNRAVFTTNEEIQDFNEINSQTVWVGIWRGQKFSFSQQGPFFDNSGLFHYSGEGVWPVMEAQLVDVGSELLDTDLIVSNSLPAWLALQSYSPVWLQSPYQPTNPGVVLFPSFLVPENLRPPYGSVHIEPSQTTALQPVPLTERYTSTHDQLATDLVRVTLYGLTNRQALDWYDIVFDYSEKYNVIGMVGEPSVVRDEKRPQPGMGLNVLAMKKTITFTVAYNMTTVRDAARQLVESALPVTYHIEDDP